MSRLDQLQKLHAADPNDPDIAYMLAHEHTKQGDPAAALHWYDTCLGMQPGYHYAYFHKAKLLQSLDRPDDARATLTAGLARSRADGNAKAVNEIGGLLDELSA